MQSVERERQYQQKLIEKINQLESQHFEVNDPEPWRNNGYNGKGNDGTIIKKQSSNSNRQESEKERKAREKAEKKLKLKLASVRQKPNASRSRLLIPSRLKPISF